MFSLPNHNVLALIIIIVLSATSNVFSEESKCQTYADGTVFPTSTVESKSHKLQYTKALSELTGITRFIDYVLIYELVDSMGFECDYSIETGTRLEGNCRDRWKIAGVTIKRLSWEIFGVLFLSIRLVCIDTPL